jgi:hypothetical protein
MQAYLRDLVKESWVSNPDDIEQFASELEPLLLERLLVKVYTVLPEEHYEHLASIVMESPDEFHAFCRTHIEHYDQLMAEVVKQFSDEYLEDIVL